MTTAAELIVDVGAKDDVTAVLRRIEAETQSFYGRLTRLTRTPLVPEIPSNVQRSIARTRDETLDLAQAEARLARASGDTIGAINRLEVALGGQVTRTRQVIQAETQLATLKRQLARESDGAASSLTQLSGTVAGLGAAFGALGLAVGAQQIGQFALAAGQQANELEKTQALVQVLARDQATYNQLVQIATTNQRAYGGSLQENLAPLGRLAPLARNLNLEITDLDRALRLLALASPEQGLEGANIALRELLQGEGAESVRSLVERFELPRIALRELTAEGLTAQEQLDGLFRVLEQEGFGAAALTAQLETTAATYDRLGASISNAIDTIGGGIAAGLEPAARGLDRLIQAALGSQTALLELGASFRGDVLNLNEALTEAQQRYASALIATGQSQDQAVEAALRQSDALATLQGLIALSNNELSAHSEQLQAVIPDMLAFAASGDEQIATLTGLIERYQSGNISIDELTETIAIYTAATDTSTQATDETSSALVDAAQAAIDLANEEREAARATDELARFQGTLARLAGQAAAGNLTAAQAASQLAAQYNIATDAALGLIQAQATLARVEAAAATARSLAFGEDLTPSATNQDIQEAKRLERESRRQIEANEEIRREAERARRRTSRAGGRSGGGGSGGRAAISDEQRLQNQILSERERAQQRLEKAEQDHQQRILSIQQRAAERQLAQERSNNLSKQESRIDFYDALTLADAEGQISSEQAQALSAAYEEAFAESQRLAQEGNKQLAADFLDLRQEQLQEELDFQRRLADARQTATDPEATGAERARAQEEISRLQAIENLRRQARDEERKQLLEQGDAIIAERDRQLAEETARFQDAQGDIIQASDFATDRKIQNALRSGKAIQAETALLREQGDVINAISGRTPTRPTPTPITTGGGGAANGVLTVQDPVLAATITDGDARLEQIVTSELGTVRAAVEAVERRVGAVEGAVRGLAGRLVN